MLSLYITILTLGLISGVHMEICPAPEDLFPCTCRQDVSGTISVECSSDLFKKLHDLETRLPLKLLQQALSSIRGKTNVDLTLKNFKTSIPSNLFSSIGIQRLYFWSCRLDSLTNDEEPGLLGLYNHLEVLGIFESSLVPAKLNIGHLKKLKKIELMRNKIPELGDDWLRTEPPSLENIVIQANDITKIGNRIFSHLNNLKGLRLEENRFGPIRRSMFPSTADRLESLNIDNNALIELPVDLFKRMPSIKYVYLRRNGITTLDERTWSPIWQQLKVVALDGNTIVCDERLHWISEFHIRPWVFGDCKAPKEFAGMSVRDFLQRITP